MAAPLRPLSAIDSITPSVQRAQQQLLKPFRFSFWWRMAVVAFFAGEFSSYSFNFSAPGGNGSGGQTSRHFLASAPHWGALRNMLPWIALGVLLLVALLFLLLYVHSVFRFILFDSVLSGECRIREFWGRRKDYGTRYFVWMIFYQLLMIFTLAVFTGLPLLMLWRAGIFSNAKEHIALLILSISLLIVLFFVFLLIAWIIGTIVKDFLVPIMALEGTSLIEAWHIYKPTFIRDKGSAAGYLGMKIVLAIALGIIVSVITLFAILILLIPSVILFVAVFALMATGKAGMVMGILLAVVAGIILLGIWFFIAGMLSVPMAVFFQSYALYYVGSRYQRLGDLLWPAAPGEMPNPSGTQPMNPASA